MSTKTIAIVGNPNCGKTTLFNKLTGSRQKVGNWAGVTVDKKTGVMRHQQQEFSVVDLPGTYSLTVASTTGSIDEKVACEYILKHDADLYINIIDASNLKRNLYLTLQLLEMKVPVIVAVNMLDIAKQRKIQIDLDMLSKVLGCPVVPIVANKNKGLDKLKATIVDRERHQLCDYPQVKFDPAIESAFKGIVGAIAEHQPNVSEAQQRWLAIRLLEQDALAEELMPDDNVRQVVVEQIASVRKTECEDPDILIADNRYAWISGIAKQCVTRRRASRITATQWFDYLAMNRFLGIPIFLFIMYLMFEFSMNLGTLLQPLFDVGSTVIFVNGVSYLGHVLGLPVWLSAIFSHGIGLGINTVITFVPQIGLLFLFLSFLEDSGYMARAAFVMDRFMQWVGLPGKSFVPLIVGFGCNVPSIMATRTLESRRDRILTSMMSPFMSCGARLAIFAVFASAFFPRHGASMVFLLYITGIVVAIITGLLLKKTVLKGASAPFVMELPIYHMPNAKSLYLLTWRRLKGFLVRAGKLIVPICVLVGSLNAIQINGTVVPTGSQDSLLSHTGRFITPIFHPMGVKQDNWPATVGLITGTLAKEVVVGTLNTLYTQDKTSISDSYKDFDLWAGLQSAWLQTWHGLTSLFSATMLNPFTANEADHNMTRSAMGQMVNSFPTRWAAFAYLLFVLLYIPCVSTMGAMLREIGRGWAWLSLAWSMDVAYAAGVIFYQASIWSERPLSASLWIVGTVLVQVVWFVVLKIWANANQSRLDELGKPLQNTSICGFKKS